MKTAQELIDELQRREIYKLENKKLDLTASVYPDLSKHVTSISRVTGIPETILIRACTETAWSYKDMEWHDILSVILHFHYAKEQIEWEDGARSGQ